MQWVLKAYAGGTTGDPTAHSRLSMSFRDCRNGSNSRAFVIAGQGANSTTESPLFTLDVCKPGVDALARTRYNNKPNAEAVSALHHDADLGLP